MPASFAQMSRVPQHPHRRSSGFIAALLVIALTFPSFAAGRTPPPTHDLDASQAAILRAESADADQYAPEALLRAKKALSQAQAALAARKTADAIGLAQLSAAEADYAHARSREAVQRSELARRRAEIAELRGRLGMEAAP
jgi:multidrug efflux pump subunit AcrA (membrane-fusion protein)